MKDGLAPGRQAEVVFEVTEAMCPAFDGVVVHRVCSTWTLVHQMELAGRKVLMPFLEPDEEGVGSHVSCDYLAPVLIDQLPECLRYTKQQLNFWRDLAWHQRIGHARDWLSIHNLSPEAAEGMQAFVEKRPVDYDKVRRALG